MGEALLQEAFEAIKNTGELAIDLLFPPVCPICAKPVLIENKGKCHDKCKAGIAPISGAVCYKCGRPLPNEEQELCNLCQTREYHYNRGYAVYKYSDEAKRLILELKYKGRRDLSVFFINTTMEKLGEELKALKADAVIPVPIHKNRLKERGYNQAELLAEELAKRLKIDCYASILVRTKETTAQKQLGNVGRMLNLMDAFAINEKKLIEAEKEKRIERVILVDDIYTTGSTAECCTFLLKSAGIKEVWLLNMCITDIEE
jgi:ComF family protein